MTSSGARADSSDRLKDATLAGVRWISIARIAGEIIAFGSMVALARLIGPSEFGKFAIAMVVHEIALTITGEGIGTALVQRRTVERAHLEAGMFMSISIGIFLGAVAFITAPLIFTPLFGSGTTDLVRLSTPLFVIAGATAVPLAVVQRRLDFRLIGLVQVVSLVVRAGVALALAVAGFEASALVLGALAASAAMMALLLVLARVPWPRPRLTAIREISGFGIPAALSGLSWTGFRNADFAIVGARLGAAEVGLYWRAYQLAIEYQRKVGSGVHQVMFPVYSRADELDAMFALRRRVVRVVAVVLIPGLAALALLAPLLVPWLFGSAWERAVVPTQILAVAGMFTVLSDTMGAVVLAAGRARAWLAYHVACFAAYGAAVYIAAGYGLVAVCGAVVAVQALGTIVAYGGLLHGLVERPLARLWEDVAPGAAGAGALVAAAAPVAWALADAGAPVPLTLLAASAVGTAACLTVVRLASREAWRDLSLLAQRAMRRRGDNASVPIAEAAPT
jgi:lipopolysaccharide exporter